jgi:hypothetical protein
VLTVFLLLLTNIAIYICIKIVLIKLIANESFFIVDLFVIQDRIVFKEFFSRGVSEEAGYLMPAFPKN